MDLSETINLLKSQIPDKSQANNVAKTTGNEDADDSVVAPEQSTGEEFSTFLTLLTAQIENQDPLAPLESTQFVEQLATFSNLELQAKGNESLELIAALLIRQIELLTPTEESGTATAINTTA